MLADLEQSVGEIIADEAQRQLFCDYFGQIEFFFRDCKACYTVAQIDALMAINERYIELSWWKSYKTKQAAALKEEFKQMLEDKVEDNRFLKVPNRRQLRDEVVTERNIISVFESSLTRMFGLEHDELTMDIMVVKAYYFDIIKDLILHGFEYHGDRYRFFTASAGQIRTKKTVFIREELWQKYERTLMCGLTVDSINSRGGINVNKFLAYLALSNSATDEWVDFDIDRCIVVPDFETSVHGEVDFIDDVSYKVERREMDIGIEHTDGCGMMLPSVSEHNFMVRLPWVKGLLTSFDYIKFITERGCEPIIADIYGKEHNLIEEDIRIIFTKSQFKMAKYYEDWDEYKRFFREFNCQAGTCKEEEEYIKPANINYQMLQTLTDITNDEIADIAAPAVRKIQDISNNVTAMLDAFGAIKGKPDLSPFQKSLLIYPELLNDKYCKRKLNDIKNSMIKDYHHGRLPVKGKFTFVVPDMFAACQYWFEGDKDPVGLLQDGEVSCRLYPRDDKLDCLRSPHLYKEHAVRNNIVNDELAEWFQTDAVYTSCHDLISKYLMFDVDGDILLVVADKNIVKVAERNMGDIVPLFYDMKKAEPAILTNDLYYEGMNAAWTGGNIGVISNDITKIWNSGDNIGDDEMLAVKWLVMENNFVIDYAKTLYKPTRPDEVNEFIRSYTQARMPRFFVEAKDYDVDHVEDINGSFVNKLRHIIRKKQLSFKNLEPLNYRKLMKDPQMPVDMRVVERYLTLSRKYQYMLNNRNNDESNNTYLINEVKTAMSEGFLYGMDTIADMLIKYLYQNDSENKSLLWQCYGDFIYENLRTKVDTSVRFCKKCGRRFMPTCAAHQLCDHCNSERLKKPEFKLTQCERCGKEFTVKITEHNRKYCDDCKEEIEIMEKSAKKAPNRPRKEVDLDEAYKLYDALGNWLVVANRMGISKDTLRRARKEAKG